jgi:hypothetical protein
VAFLPSSGVPSATPVLVFAIESLPSYIGPDWSVEARTKTLKRRPDLGRATRTSEVCPKSQLTTWVVSVTR